MKILCNRQDHKNDRMCRGIYQVVREHNKLYWKIYYQYSDHIDDIRYWRTLVPTLFFPQPRSLRKFDFKEYMEAQILFLKE